MAEERRSGEEDPSEESLPMATTTPPAPVEEALDPASPTTSILAERLASVIIVKSRVIFKSTASPNEMPNRIRLHVRTITIAVGVEEEEEGREGEAEG